MNVDGQEWVDGSWIKTTPYKGFVGWWLVHDLNQHLYKDYPFFITCHESERSMEYLIIKSTYDSKDLSFEEAVDNAVTYAGPFPTLRAAQAAWIIMFRT